MRQEKQDVLQGGLESFEHDAINFILGGYQKQVANFQIAMMREDVSGAARAKEAYTDARERALKKYLELYRARRGRDEHPEFAQIFVQELLLQWDANLSECIPRGLQPDRHEQFRLNMLFAVGKLLSMLQIAVDNHVSSGVPASVPPGGDMQTVRDVSDVLDDPDGHSFL